MNFIATKLSGAFVIEPERFADERGFLARAWSAREFAAQNLAAPFAECNISYNRRRGTLRGMHFQRPPHAQAKLVRCTRGAIYDVIIDLRTDSPTYKQWLGVELTAENRRMLYVPADFAHGFQTLTDDTELYYQMAERVQKHVANPDTYPLDNELMHLQDLVGDLEKALILVAL